MWRALIGGKVENMQEHMGNVSKGLELLTGTYFIYRENDKNFIGLSLQKLWKQEKSSMKYSLLKRSGKTQN
jgi:hypothetical protein